jgi:hypothetical protein
LGGPGCLQLVVAQQVVALRAPCRDCCLLVS